MSVVDLGEVREMLDRADEIAKRFENQLCAYAFFARHVFMPMKDGEVSQGCLYCNYRRQARRGEA